VDSHALLCETCGYSLVGLAGDGACPECGRLIATSRPEARPGSAWQRGAGLFALLKTNWAVLRSPRSEFSRIRIEPRTGTGLLVINTLATAAFFIDPWVGVIVGDPARGARLAGGAAGWAMVGAVWIAETMLAAAVLWLLTWIEYRGIRFFSRRRGWRLTPEGAWQVCCHASVGWLMLGVLPMLTLAAFQALTRVFHLGPPRGGLLLGWGPFSGMSWSEVTYGAGLLVALVAGMLVFEVLVYVGVRQCRYAATLSRVIGLPPDADRQPVVD
jgi:hypothetical protein